MTSWGASVRALAVGAALLAACSNDGDPDAGPTTTGERSTTTTTTTAPERPTSTTTTAFDPASVEGQVEAAYLRSWDVYAEAVYNLELDEAALAEVYAEDGLENVRREIQGRIDDGRAAHVRVEHRYDIIMTNDSLGSVVDRLINHQVLIDPETKEPIEPDPNEEQLLNFVMKRVGTAWFVTLVQGVDP